MNQPIEKSRALSALDQDESVVDGLVDVMLTILVFGKGKCAAPLGARRLGDGLPAINVGVSFRDSYYFELACYAVFEIDSWHAMKGILKARDRIFRATVLPRFFSVFQLPTRVVHLERVVVHRLRTYEELQRIAPSDLPLCFAENVLKSVVRCSPSFKLGGPDYWFLSDHMVAAMAMISDLAEFSRSRLPLFLEAFDSFYRRLPDEWSER